MSKVEVTAHRWSGGWELHLDGEPVTQVATLDRAVQQIRDYLDTIVPEVNHASWDVEVTPDLGGLEDQVREARQATADAAAATLAAAMETRDVVRRLRAENISVTDTAAILGVSRGRVSQLTKAR